MRVLRKASADLSQAFGGDEGYPRTPDGPVEVALFNPDGTEAGTVMASAPPTPPTPDPGEPEPEVSYGYGYSFPPQVMLGVYTVEWSAEFDGVSETVSDFIEVVGRRIFTLKEARAVRDLSDREKYSDALVESVREQVENEFQKITGQSFIPRGARLDGEDTPSGAHHPLIRIVSLYETGIEYEYGYRQVPAEVKREALVRARDLIVTVNSAIPDRATAFVAAQGGTYTLATPGRAGYETGVPSVDAVLSRYKTLATVIF